MEVGTMASLQDLRSRGQSVWLDYLDRRLLADDGLRRLVEVGVQGVTTNPTIFHEAIATSEAYDDAIRDLLQADPNIEPAQLYEWLTVQDVQVAADQLSAVYEASKGHDGYVSLEVSPHLANDTVATVQAAHHLWKTVHRPNLMIKVPATAAGIPAIEALIAEGINVNATLLFSIARYEAVVRAYLRGTERCERPAEVASVASVFVSRVDTAVDRQLDALKAPTADALRGRSAVASARLVYQRFLDMFSQSLAGGAHLQRPLWASTGTKDRRYSDVKYVESLIGRDTVTTLPRETLDAFLHHGEARNSLTEDVERAQHDLLALQELGIDLVAVTDALERDGVAKFAKSYADTLVALHDRCSTVTRRFAG
jgi:transaldolase